MLSQDIWQCLRAETTPIQIDRRVRILAQRDQTSPQPQHRIQAFQRKQSLELDILDCQRQQFTDPASRIVKPRNEDLVSGILCGTNELVNIIRADRFLWESRIGCTMTCLDPLDLGREASSVFLCHFQKVLTAVKWSRTVRSFGEPFSSSLPNFPDPRHKSLKILFGHLVEVFRCEPAYVPEPVEVEKYPRAR